MQRGVNWGMMLERQSKKRRNKLAVFKAPTIVEFMDSLPRNASGKILKRVLRDESQRPPE